MGRNAWRMSRTPKQEHAALTRMVRQVARSASCATGAPSCTCRIWCVAASRACAAPKQASTARTSTTCIGKRHTRRHDLRMRDCTKWWMFSAIRQICWLWHRRQLGHAGGLHQLSTTSSQHNRHTSCGTPCDHQMTEQYLACPEGTGPIISAAKGPTSSMVYALENNLSWPNSPCTPSSNLPKAHQGQDAPLRGRGEGRVGVLQARVRPRAGLQQRRQLAHARAVQRHHALRQQQLENARSAPATGLQLREQRRVYMLQCTGRIYLALISVCLTTCACYMVQGHKLQAASPHPDEH